MDWSDKAIEQMKAYLAAGKSCSQIAAAMGGGVTRSAVIGKLHRLGIMGNKTAPIRSTAHAPRKRLKAVLAQDAPAPVLDAAGNPISLRTARSDNCRWIADDPPTHESQICGNPTTKPGAPWCAHHAARAHNATATDQARQAMNAVATVKARVLQRAL